MRRRRLLLLSFVLALLVLWGWLVLRSKLQPLGVPTRANFERVQEGMTMEEVEAILGPPGEHTERLLIRWLAGVCVSARSDGTFRQEWIEDDAIITIAYSDSDRPRVSSKRYVEFSPESFRDRLRPWLPWCERVFGAS